MLYDFLMRRVHLFLLNDFLTENSSLSIRMECISPFFKRVTKAVPQFKRNMLFTLISNFRRSFLISRKSETLKNLMIDPELTTKMFLSLDQLKLSIDSENNFFELISWLNSSFKRDRRLICPNSKRTIK